MKFQQNRQAAAAADPDSLPIIMTGAAGELADRLIEAHEYLGGTLRSRDAFRLVSEYVARSLPYSVLALYVSDRSRSDLELRHWTWAGSSGSLDPDLPRRCYADNSIMCTGGSAAVPLTRSSEAYGVLHLGLASDSPVDGSIYGILQAIGLYASPFLLSSISVDRTHEAAAIDILVDLINEREFRARSAEILATGGGRGSVMSVDVKQFGEIDIDNTSAAAVELLRHAARLLKPVLREMDLLAKANGDEFLILLPGAGSKDASSVSVRMHEAFAHQAGNAGSQVRLEVGFASSPGDGQTIDDLLRYARARKCDARATGLDRKVLPFTTVA